MINTVYHHAGPCQEWVEPNVAPFDELILSWNADRPTDAQYQFYVSLYTDVWSIWLPYASWGCQGQSSFQMTDPNRPVEVYQDTVNVLNHEKATGFRIKIDSTDHLPPARIDNLHVFINNHTPLDSPSMYDAISLPLEGLSQTTLQHPRCMDLCSPTSTTAVIRYLQDNPSIDPIQFAQDAWDREFDIFGNWVLNIAAASTILGPTWQCWVERLSGFDAIYQHLKQGIPVIVSVRGPLPGSALPYSCGHLIAITGYDPEQNKVLCIDPAFPSAEQTHSKYDLNDFIHAWNRRGRIAYIFQKTSLSCPNF